MLIGVTPFFNRNKNVLLSKIKQAKVIFPDKTKYKIEYSDDIVDLIVKLLEKDKTKRLGAKDDFVEILSHPFFYGLDIEKIEKKLVKPPFRPQVTNDLTKYFNVQDSQQAISDTYIPRENRKIVQQNNDVFNNFNTKKKK